MRVLIFILVLFFTAQIFNSCKSEKTNPKTILGIFAHPDDEMAVADVLVKYARLGHKVYVMIATDGKGGTRVSNIPAGDSLGEIRKLESICACEKMGIEPPVFLSVERLDTRIGVRDYLNAHKRVRDSLLKLIPLLNPDVILTFGPDGDSHHSEHIVIGSVVTEILLAEGWVKKYPLYYVAFTNEEKGEGGEANSVHVDKQYFNVKIDFTDEDELKGLEANRCFVSQFTPEELNQYHKEKISDKNNTIHFRRFTVKKGMQKDF